MPDTLDTFQVLLPPFPAALVPSWAMVPQSVPEAFLLDFLSSVDQIRFLGIFSFFKFGAAPVKCCWLETSRVQSAAGVE